MGALKLEEKYTYDDYKNWEDRFELINGVPYAMAPAPIPKHQMWVGKIYRELTKNLECENCEVFIAPIDWKIDEYNILQPDVAIFCEDYEDIKYFSTTPPVVVEVLSLSTALKDLTIKYKLYEKAGVKYYVVVNPETKEIKAYINENGFSELDFDDKIEFNFNDCKTEIDIKNL